MINHYDSPTFAQTAEQINAIIEECDKQIEWSSLEKTDPRVHIYFHTKGFCTTTAGVSIGIQHYFEKDPKFAVPVLSSIIGIRNFSAIPDVISDLIKTPKLAS